MLSSSGSSCCARRRLSALLREAGVPLAGFITAELRERGGRVGFALETFDGASAVLAHVGLPGPPRVGKYGVDLAALERLALPALASAPAGGVVLIDELGKMELASEAFRAAVARLFEKPVALVADDPRRPPSLHRRAEASAPRRARPGAREQPGRAAAAARGSPGR